MANKWVYMFSEGDMTMRNLLGGKGANLAEMTSIGLPVPQGFTITTEACTQYYEDCLLYTSCYREERTGDRFMALCKNMQILNCCHPNALMTLKEYLEDYASERCV